MIELALYVELYVAKNTKYLEKFKIKKLINIKEKKTLGALSRLFVSFYLATTLFSSEHSSNNPGGDFEDTAQGILLQKNPQQIICKKNDSTEFLSQLNSLSLTKPLKEKISSIYGSSKSEICFEIDGDIKTRRLLSTDSSLRESGFFIEDGSINVLALALGQNTSLRFLNIANNGLENQELAILAKPLQHNQMLCLHTLDFSDNQIGDSGAVTLASCLAQNTMRFLHNLYLSDNEIGDSGLTALTKSLEQNTVLYVLDLANNRIGNTKMGLALKSLSQNTMLYALDLRYNTIDVFLLLERKIIDVSTLNRVIFFNSSTLPFQSKPVSNWPLKLIPLPLTEITISEGRIKINQNKRHIRPRPSLLNHGDHHHTCSIC